MAKRNLIVCALGIALACTMPGLAQNTLWNTYIEAGRKAFEQGRYAESERLFKEALQAAETAGDKGVRLERSLLNLGTVYKDQARYDEAERMTRQAIAIIENSNDRFAKQDLALALNNLAALHTSQGRIVEAIELYKQSLELAEKKFGKGSVDTALPVNNLASLLIQNGEYMEAGEALGRITPAFAKYPKRQQSLDFAYLVFNGALLAKERAQFKTSEQLYKSAIQIGEKVYGPKHRYNAMGMQGLAELYMLEERYDEAEKLLQRSVALVEEATSPQSPETANALQALAKCYVEQGKYTAAEPLCKRALSISEKVFGPNHVSQAPILCIMAQIREQTGDYAEAENLLKTALRMRESTFGAKTPQVRTTLRQLGECFYDQGKYAEAEDYFNQALAVTDQATKTGAHPEIPEINKDLARCYLKQNRLADAQTAFDKAFRDIEKMYGADSPKVIDAKRDIVDIALAAKDFAKAQSALSEIMRADEASQATAKLVVDYEALAKIYAGLNNSAQSQVMLSKANELKKTLPGSRFVAELQQVQSAKPSGSSMSADKPVADKWALIVGISNFADPTINLKYATKDAIDFRNFLVNKAHFQPDHVKLLTDAEATRENLTAQMGPKWLGRLANRDDLVVVYISSHGSSAQEKANGTNFLVAHDTRKESLLSTGIPMQWLTGMVNEQIHSDRVVLILDVCHGGAAASESKGLVRSNGVDLDGLTLGRGQAVLCSSLADQLSWESRNYPNSVFTRRLIEALSVDGDKTTLQKAYEYLRDSVESEVLRDRGQRQTPVLNEKLWEGSDAVISVTPAKPRPGLVGQR